MSSPRTSPIGRYIDAIAGAETNHQAIAAAINQATEGARVAGPLVGRWRKGTIAISPGNLAALARAYDRSPLEAFVVAGLLDRSDAEPGLDADAVKLIKKIIGDTKRGDKGSRQVSAAGDGASDEVDAAIDITRRALRDTRPARTREERTRMENQAARKDPKRGHGA